MSMHCLPCGASSCPKGHPLNAPKSRADDRLKVYCDAGCKGIIRPGQMHQHCSVCDYDNCQSKRCLERAATGKSSTSRPVRLPANREPSQSCKFWSRALLFVLLFLFVGGVLLLIYMGTPKSMLSIDPSTTDEVPLKFEEPTFEEPTFEEPTFEEPTIEEPTFEEPTIEEPTFEEPNWNATSDETTHDATAFSPKGIARVLEGVATTGFVLDAFAPDILPTFRIALCNFVLYSGGAARTKVTTLWDFAVRAHQRRAAFAAAFSAAANAAMTEASASDDEPQWLQDAAEKVRADATGDWVNVDVGN